MALSCPAGGAEAGSEPRGLAAGLALLLLGCVFGHSPPLDPTTLSPTCRHPLAAQLCTWLCQPQGCHRQQSSCCGEGATTSGSLRL